MKTRLADFKAYAADKRIAVIGAGVSNRPLIRWLHAFSPGLSVFDRMEDHDPRLIEIKDTMAGLGINMEWHTGKDYLAGLAGYDLIFRTPGIRADLPELIRERQRGAIITSEIALFTELCPAPLYGVTGSDGKTTTVTLISRILEAGGHRVLTGGNIGTPLLDRIEEIVPDDRVILEFSSFQLMDLLPVVHRAVITHVIPNHLDYHTDFAEYKNCKKNLFRAQGLLDALILNACDPISSEWMVEARGGLRWFNRKMEGPVHSAWREDHHLWVQEPGGQPVRLMAESEVALPGSFNLENILAAAVATLDDVPLEAIRQVAASFRGVEHRMEWIRELDGVNWYNSSVDSSPDRTRKTLEAFENHWGSMVLIMGGRDKRCDYSGLGRAVCQATDRIVLCGENAPLILKSIREECEGAGRRIDDLQLVQAPGYQEAVLAARKLARKGDVVLLSPAGTSFDRFSNFEERGTHFKALAEELKSSF